MKRLLYAGIALIAITFFIDHVQHGWYRPIGQGPEETGVTMGNLWTPVDAGTLLIIAYFVLSALRAVVRRVQQRLEPQEQMEPSGALRSARIQALTMQMVLWSGIGTVLLAFLVKSFQHGLLGATEQIVTTPSGKTLTMTTVNWTPVDLGCYLIIAYLMFALARSAVRFNRARSL